MSTSGAPSPRTLATRARAISSLIVFLMGIPAWGAMKLMTVEPGVPVYTGPGEHYRLLTSLAEKTEIKASEEITSSPSGRFYRVLVVLEEKQKAVGFIAVNAPVRVGDLDQDEDDLTKYGPVVLMGRGFQMTFGSYRDSQSMWTAGYQHYLSPGFFVKPFAGQWSNSITNAFVAGGEMGNDALLVGAFSGYVSFGLGLMNPSTDGGIFLGSSSYNVMMHGTVGVRYNIDGFASIALGGAQTSFYNQNNSLVSTGIQASLEVGL